MIKSKKNKKIPLSYRKIYPLFLLLATVFMGIGYAAVNSISFEISGTGIAAAQDGVFILDVNYNSNNMAVINNCKVNTTSQTMLSTSIELSSNSSSYIIYDVTIYNNTTDKYIYTGPIHSDKFYTDNSGQYNSNVTYSITGITEGYILQPKSSVPIQIKYQYSGNTTTQNTLNSHINIQFKKAYTVEYIDMDNSNFPSYIAENGTLTLDVSSMGYDSFEVTMGGTTLSNYTYENGILVISNITGDVTIKGVKNQPSSGLPAGKHFDVTFHDQGGSNYNYSLSFTNITDQDSTAWALYIVVPSDAKLVGSTWGCNAEIVDGILIVTDAGWNGAISAGASAGYIAGFTIETSDSNFSPSNYTAIFR